MIALNSKERFLAVIAGLKADKPPVFPLLMGFSAKRYGITYREYASNGHSLAESQLKIREMFPVDAITACSDAFRISGDLGGDIIFPENKPPYISKPLITSRSDFAHLKRPNISGNVGRMADRIQAVDEMVKAVGENCMVLGWIDLPFAEACSLCGVSNFMYMMFDEPELAHKILEFLTEIVTEFALLQLETGAPMIGAGNAAASLISVEQYREFALPYDKRICESIHKEGGLVKLHICGDTKRLVDDMITSGCDLFNVDHMVDFEFAAKMYHGARKAFKGNLNPVSDILYSTPEGCQDIARNCIQKAKGYPYMLSAGCEIPTEVDDEVFMAFCNA